MELTSLMPDDRVKRVDNITMAWGLEAWAPFLDHELVELADQVRLELTLLQGRQGNSEGHRPATDRDRCGPSQRILPGVGLSRLDGDVLNNAVDVLRSPAANPRGLIEPGYVDALLADPHRRFGGRGDRLWHLGVLEMWLQVHGIGA